MYDISTTQIACPKCHEYFLRRQTPRVIKSNTVENTYICPGCGFVHAAESDEDMQEYANSYIAQEETIVKSSNSMVRETDIKCPICGAFIFCDESMILTSNPPQHRYYCPECGKFSHSSFSDGYLQDYIKKNFTTNEDSVKSEEEILKEQVQVFMGMVKETTDYHAKQDYGKAKLSLVPRRIIWDVAAIREYGNNKYPDGGPDNWKGVEPERYRDAAYRHFLGYLDDPRSVDAESGLPHLWHLACNIAFLCEMEDIYLSKNPEVVERLKKEFLGYQPPSEEGEENALQNR